MWLFANIVNNENVTVQEEFVDLDLMDRQEHHHVLSNVSFLNSFLVMILHLKIIGGEKF